MNVQNIRNARADIEIADFELKEYLVDDSREFRKNNAIIRLESALSNLRKDE